MLGEPIRNSSTMPRWSCSCARALGQCFRCRTIIVSVRRLPSWRAGSPMGNVPTRCRDERRPPSPNPSSSRQTDREGPSSRRPRTPRVCLGARSRVPRQTTRRHRFVDVVSSRPTRPRSSPTTSTNLLLSRRKFGALANPPARPPQKTCSSLHR